jgi:UDP-N-acetyl-D-mannosaminuronate dehydrogenase
MDGLTPKPSPSPPAATAFPPENGAKVLILHVAHKKDIDDMRESPALAISELLQKEGATARDEGPTEFKNRARLTSWP